MALARGEFVTMLDSDDLLLPRYLEVMGGALESDPSAGFAYTDAFVLDHETGHIRSTTMMAYQRPPKIPPADAGAFFRLLLDRNFVCPATTVRKSVLVRVGGFDERLWRAEDWELWLRIANAGYSAVRPPGVLLIHRDRSGSLSTDLQKSIESILRVYRFVDQEYETPADVRALVRKKCMYWERYLRRLSDPRVPLTLVERARSLARLLKRRALTSRLWRKSPPGEISKVLRTCGVGPPAR